MTYIILAVIVILCLYWLAFHNATEGYEDKDGFHRGKESKVVSDKCIKEKK